MIGPGRSAPIWEIEFGLTLIAASTAFVLPRLGFAFFSRIEAAFGRLARRRGMAATAVGVSALLLRLAILPLVHVPLPFVPDDFSFLLAADTFAHGRLTNPTPAMWTHLESIHITMHPTYMSMYFPGQGLVMAASKILFGHPWFGLLIVSALMCAAICWMLQAWLPASWALLGGLISVVHLGLFSYWINTYHAAGSLGALGGALLLGALPRIAKKPSLRYTMLMALGVVILGLTRPYECLLLCLPVAVVLGRWVTVGKNRPTGRALFRIAAAPLLLVIAGAAWMGYYDYRAFGNPTTLPYIVSRDTYAIAPYYVWQKARPEPAYRHRAMRDYYAVAELDFTTRMRSGRGFVAITVGKVIVTALFFAGFALLAPAFMLRRVLLDRRIRFLVVCVMVLAAGMAIEIFFLPHYLAPFTAAFYAIGLQAMRHLRVWSPRGQPVGVTLVRLTVTVCVVMAGLRLYAGPLHLPLPEWPSTWNFTWYGPDHFGTARARVETELERLPGKQLVIVRYSSRHNPYEEWVYNAANIDTSKVVWAREMGPSNNQEIIHYYSDRHVWLVEPDLPTPVVSSYLLPEQASGDTRQPAFATNGDINYGR